MFEEGLAVMETHVFDGIFVFSPRTIIASVKRVYPHCAIKYVLLSKGQ